jgi:hypothetical protein
MSTQVSGIQKNKVFGNIGIVFWQRKDRSVTPTWSKSRWIQWSLPCQPPYAFQSGEYRKGGVWMDLKRARTHDVLYVKDYISVALFAYAFYS